MLPGIHSAIAGARRNAPLLTGLGDLTITTNSTTYNYGNVVVPRAGLLIACPTIPLGSSANRTFSSVSVGGVAMTIHQTQVARYQQAVVASKEVAAGTFAMQSVVSGTGAMNSAISLYLLEEYESPTPYDTAYFNQNSGGTPCAVAMDVPDYGVAIFAHVRWGGASDTVWVGATEDADINMESNTNRHSTAYLRPTSLETNRSISISGVTDHVLAAACWR